jgi:hypothetical protein
MSGFGKKRNDVHHQTTSLDEQGFSLVGIKHWRAAQMATGKPSSLNDFFRVHGICETCQCYGLHMTGWDEADGVPLWSICPTCGGSGRIAGP